MSKKMSKENKDPNPVAKRKWHIEAELSNGQLSYYSVLMADLAPYIKRRRLKLQQKGDYRSLAPVEAWVIEFVMENWQDSLSLFESNPPTIVRMKISRAKSTEG
jgi:hypothetical protein